MPSLSRRHFLEISTAAAGVTAVGAIPAFAHGVLNSSETLRTVPTICDVCFWKCGSVAHLRDGKLWKILGNEIDPLSEGRLCPRGTGGIGAHYDANRLTSPLIRKTERGQEQWVEASWDEALRYIAERMLKIKAKYGPESMALFSHGIGGKFFKHTMHAYGTPNIAAPSYAQCRGPRDVGFSLTFGEGVSTPERTDIANAECLVLIGSHLGENMHNTQVQEFAQAIEKGASIIVVDPRFSVAASKAKYYLPIKPGTDIALLLAWMNVLVTEELYDKEYVDAYGFGFEAFAAEIAPYTPEWAYPKTTIDPTLIRETAREMARYKPASLVHPGRHVTWYGDDAQRGRAMALLNALLGSWGRKGGFYYPAGMDVPGYPYPDYPAPTRPKADNPDHKYPFADGTLTNGLRDATISGKPYPIKGWMVYATNLIEALPNQQETIRAIQELDLMVVVDVIPSEIAGWADVVEPPDDQKPGWWIARELAKKLGLESYYPWKDMEEYLRTRVESAGLSFDKLKKDGVILGPKQPLYFDEGVPAEFDTPSGKIEFYSTQLAEAGFDPVPKFTPPEEPPPGAFRLLFGRAPVHSFSRTQTNPILSDLMDENEAWINQDIARRYGLDSGDYVRLKNSEGVESEPVRVKATQRIRGDCIFITHGFGHTARGIFPKYKKGASDAGLITQYKVDPLMGATGMNVNFVTLELEA
ncbi:MAG: molybdopterin-dependent oxidoreductase [Deltaproteobacteria bacterium]|nr:molybdopterin-dependent oxidoreductase [Deltaproteobacteria bacterium]